MIDMGGLFESIRREFPELRMDLGPATDNVDRSLEIPRQPGLHFDVSLNQQGDELHLMAGIFWLEWFPCDDEQVAAAYREAVVGLLAGQYRIVEHYRRGRGIKAQLQRPADGEWKTIGTWSNLGTLGWGAIDTRVLQNSGAS